MFYDKLYYTKSLEIMNYLIANGHRCVKVKRDMTNNVSIYFYFAWNEELETLVEEYKKKLFADRIKALEEGVWTPNDD